MRTSHLSSSAPLACVLKRHSHLMVNDRLRELCLSLSRIGTPRPAAVITRQPAATSREIVPRLFQDHCEIIQLL